MDTSSQSAKSRRSAVELRQLRRPFHAIVKIGGSLAQAFVAMKAVARTFVACSVAGLRNSKLAWTSKAIYLLAFSPNFDGQVYTLHRDIAIGDILMIVASS